MYYICQKQGRKYGVKDTKDNTIEFYTEEQLRAISTKCKLKVFGLRYDSIGVINITVSSFPNLIEGYLIPYLRRGGIYIMDDDNQYESSTGTYSTRFIGDFDAWSGDDEDICDADTINPKVAKTIRELCASFSRRTGFEVHWSSDCCKAWSTFTIS